MKVSIFLILFLSVHVGFSTLAQSAKTSILDAHRDRDRERVAAPAIVLGESEIDRCVQVVNAEIQRQSSYDPHVHLLHSCVGGDVPMVKYLVSNLSSLGADPQALVCEEDLGHAPAEGGPFFTGDTAITVAARFGNDPVCDWIRRYLLTRSKADVTTKKEYAEQLGKLMITDLRDIPAKVFVEGSSISASQLSALTRLLENIGESAVDDPAAIAMDSDHSSVAEYVSALAEVYYDAHQVYGRRSVDEEARKDFARSIVGVSVYSKKKYHLASYKNVFVGSEVCFTFDNYCYLRYQNLRFYYLFLNEGKSLAIC